MNQEKSSNQRDKPDCGMQVCTVAAKQSDLSPHQMERAMFWYKINPCRYGTDCPYGRDCFGYHSEQERRREWWKHPVTRLMNIKFEKCTTGYPGCSRNCVHKQDCPKYHTNKEFLYHPCTYKCHKCTDTGYKNTGHCSRGSLCWQYHSEREKVWRENYNSLPDMLHINKLYAFFLFYSFSLS